MTEYMSSNVGQYRTGGVKLARGVFGSALPGSGASQLDELSCLGAPMSKAVADSDPLSCSDLNHDLRARIRDSPATTRPSVPWSC